MNLQIRTDLIQGIFSYICKDASGFMTSRSNAWLRAVTTHKPSGFMIFLFFIFHGIVHCFMI
jgi:hypothetical protein